MNRPSWAAGMILAATGCISAAVTGVGLAAYLIGGFFMGITRLLPPK